ncbi:MAG: MFS transporter [Clostridiales Family XIII bacterium]|jgi:predicted MFS family arabinose efflux permease|nr:MFS transporter [Clostridiales Family XIII bacterium]
MNIKKFLALVGLGWGGGSIYVMPYIKYVFYDQQLEIMNINNTQSGMLVTAYALVAICIMIPGGAVLDRIKPKTAILASLAATTLLSLLYTLTLDFRIAIAIWIGFGFSCGFVYWPAINKALATVGTAREYGRMFGTYYLFNGVFAAVIEAVALYMSTQFGDARTNFFWAMMVCTLGSAVGFLLVLLLYKDNISGEEVARSEDDKFKLTDVTKALKSPTTWMFAIICFCAYTVYSSISYFTPYLTAVHGVTPETSGVFAVIRSYLFNALALCGGLIADKILHSTCRWFLITYSIALCFIVGLFLLPDSITPIGAGIYTLAPAAVIMCIYGIRYTVMRELDIPKKIMGTVIGCSATVSWTPDLFMHSMYGSWLDKYGVGGYSMIFTYMIICAVILLATVTVAYRRAKRLGIYEKLKGSAA